MKKNNRGPRVTRYERKPPSRSVAGKVWVAAYHLFGCPPSFMRVIPPSRYYEEAGERILTKTTRWEIGYPEDDEEYIVVHGPAKKAIEAIGEATV